MPEQTLQIAEERREVKGKGERERYPLMNAEFQKNGKERQEAFLNEQCKERGWERPEIISRKLEISGEYFME